MSSSASQPGRAFSYPYTPVEWGSSKDIAPMASALLSWKRRKQRALMLMDTGANRTFLPASLAELLSLEVSTETQTAQAGGGPLQVRKAKVEVSLEEPFEGGRIGRTHLLNPVLVFEEGRLPFPILGREPFLQWYDLRVSQRNRMFSLSEVR